MNTPNATHAGALKQRERRAKQAAIGRGLREKLPDASAAEMPDVFLELLQAADRNQRGGETPDTSR